MYKEGCKQPLLKLQKHMGTAIWHSSKATDHMKNNHFGNDDTRITSLAVIKGVHKRQVCNHKYSNLNYLIIMLTIYLTN